MKFLIFSFLVIATFSLFGQRSINYELIHEDTYLAVINYDGKFKSVAEKDTASLPAFEMMSIGRLVDTEVVSSGFVRVILEYQGGGMIVLQSQKTYEKDNASVFSWQRITEDNYDYFGNLNFRNNRESLVSRVRGGILIGIINVKPRDIPLFKYLVSTISF